MTPRSRAEIARRGHRRVLAAQDLLSVKAAEWNSRPGSELAFVPSQPAEIDHMCDMFFEDDEDAGAPMG